MGLQPHRAEGSNDLPPKVAPNVSPTGSSPRALSAGHASATGSGALPRQLPLQRGESMLERLADQPSLPIGDRVEGLDRSPASPGR